MSWLVTRLWLYLDGWKTVLGYILVQLPWFAGQPMLLNAIMAVIANYDPRTNEGAEAWADLIVQLVLLTGIFHVTVKNMKYGTLRAGKLFLCQKPNS